MGQDHRFGRELREEIQLRQGRLADPTRTHARIDQQVVLAQSVQVTAGPDLVGAAQADEKEIAH